MYYFGPFSLDGQRLVLSLRRKPLALGPKVVATLLALVERSGQTVTKQELLDRVWPDAFVEEGTLAQNVYVLRKVLRAHWQDAIETLPRRGYRFTRTARTSEAPQFWARSWRAWYVGSAAALAFALGFGLLHDTARSRPAEQQLTPAGARMYAIGDYYWKHRTAESLAKSVFYFRAVLKTDPHNARAYAALARAYAIEGDYGFGPMTYDQKYAVARKFARQALALDSGSAEAHAAMGIAQDRPPTRQASQREYIRAIALDPSYAPARQWYGMSLLQEGLGREAFVQLRNAAQLDPVSVATLSWLAEAAYYTRQYHAALLYAHEAMDLSPQRPDPYVVSGLAYEALGRFGPAEAAYRSYGKYCRCSADAAALLAHAYAAQGDFGHAQAQFAVAQRARGMEKAEPTDMAFALIALGRRNAALQTLRQGHLGMWDAVLALEPRLDPVRTDPRFRHYVCPKLYT